MCGITGYAGFHQPGLLSRMCDTLAHRGPDDHGQAEFPEHQVAIGMRRLAIIDLAGGKQPFHTPDHLVTLVQNGEIYNHESLRRELEALGHHFHSRSDTEVILEAYLEWGDQAWTRFLGMFAIAILDRRGPHPQLKLIRDHVGIKPLYYAELGSRLLFASEIKALLQFESLSPTIANAAVLDYLALRYVPGPGTLLEGISKLPAGHQLTWTPSGTRLHQWWFPPSSSEVDPSLSRADSIQHFGDALRKAVHSHMISDVPVGAYLSGGIDSNAIVALMSEASPTPVHTFSIGFPDFPDADRSLARLTARALNTNHVELECRAADFAHLSDIVWALDEPIGDAIVVPMSMLAREARKSVTVVLSGEGADEILGGYMFHRNLSRLEKLRAIVPSFAWQMAAGLVNAFPSGLLDALFDYPGKLGREGKRKVVHLLNALSNQNLAHLYTNAITLIDQSTLEKSLNSGLELSTLQSLNGTHPGEGSPLQQLVAMQYQHWLQDDILMKADKMNMMHSIEGRVPYLDREVISAAARIPDRFKIGASTNKIVLRQFARTLLPPEVVSAPKRAFYVPLESYMRHPEFQELLNHSLDKTRVLRRGLFRPEWLESLRNSPPSAGFLPYKQLFSIVMLEQWFDRFCPDATWA